MGIAPWMINAQRGYVTGARGSEVWEQGALAEGVAGLDLQAGAVIPVRGHETGQKAKAGAGLCMALGPCQEFELYSKGSRTAPAKGLRQKNDSTR